jgi:hypothetical protein
VEPGWYPDPWRRHELRWHNGRDWTADIADRGHRGVDAGQPVPAVAPPPLGPPQVATRPARNGAAVAALVLGIFAIMVGFVPLLFWMGGIAAVLAIVFGVVGLRRSRRGGEAGRSGFAVAGLVLGPLGLVATVVGGYVTVLVVRTVQDIVDVGAYRISQESCAVGDGRAVLHGTITNDSDDTRDYTVFVEFRREGTDNALGFDTVGVDDVAPGDTAEFTASSLVGAARVTCVVTEVIGPLPFDLD